METTPVGTPVHVAVVADGVASVRTYDPSGKLKRMRRDVDVDVVPSTGRGRVTGPTVAARAWILAGGESEIAAAALAEKYPLLHGHLIPWYHRRKGLVTTQIELTPALMDVAAELGRHRDFLMGVAYRLLGSVQAAEDVVQDAYLRAQRADTEAIAAPRAWMTRIVTRLALDELRSARVRREAYVGPWLPEPVLAPLDAADPADRVTLDEQVSLALLTVLETLSPAERAVYVLHEAFGVPLQEVAGIVGRTPEACRQLARRARRHVHERAPRFDASPGEQARLVEAFKAASERGDLEALAVLLDDDVVLRADGGGVVAAARHPVAGRDRVVRTLAAGLRSAPDVSIRVILVNGDPGLLVRFDGRVAVFAFVVASGRIAHIDIVANPAKLEGALQL